uniref:Transmembrane protein n=1 Tax=Medicago truncatula TaxID=3880 RepID=I3SLL5_MEDTR|nr:unknown [Medicago truncatula]
MIQPYPQHLLRNRVNMVLDDLVYPLSFIIFCLNANKYSRWRCNAADEKRRSDIRLNLWNFFQSLFMCIQFSVLIESFKVIWPKNKVFSRW